MSTSTTSGIAPGALLAIDGEMTIYRAAELRESLQAALAAGGDLEVDLGGVTEMDSAGVQLLLAAKKSAQARQNDLHLAAPSAAVLEVLDFLDLAGHLGARH